MAHVLTDTDGGDISAVAGLLVTVEGPTASVIADGAYVGAFVYKAASLRQRDPPLDIVIPPRATSTITTTDTSTPAVRGRHARYIAQKGRMAWQKATGYGRRSLVETAIGRYKHIVGPKLKARSLEAQQGEVAVAIQVLNRMTRITDQRMVPSSDTIFAKAYPTLTLIRATTQGFLADRVQ